MRFYCEDKILEIKAGDVGFLPQGKAHAFNCTSPVVRTLILVQAISADPVGLDNYFLAMGEAARDMQLPRDAITYAVDDPERALRIAALYGIRILSPLEAEKELPQYPGLWRSGSLMTPQSPAATARTIFERAPTIRSATRLGRPGSPVCESSSRQNTKIRINGDS